MKLRTTLQKGRPDHLALGRGKDRVAKIAYPCYTKFESRSIFAYYFFEYCKTTPYWLFLVREITVGKQLQTNGSLCVLSWYLVSQKVAHWDITILGWAERVIRKGETTVTNQCLPLTLVLI